MNGQRGQAIVGVLVIMTLVFLVTGAVAVGTSTLLTRLRGPATAVDHDLAVRSAAAGAAGVALGSSGCGGEKGPYRGQGTVTLPASGDIGSTQSHVSCAMVDHALNQVVRVDVQSGVCTTTDISGQLSGKTDWWILFAARLSQHWLAYVASQSQFPTCQTSPSKVPLQRACRAVPMTSSDSGVLAVAMHCNTQISQTQVITDPALFVFNAQASFPAYLVPHDTITTPTTPTNSYYLATAGTGLSHPDYEQVLVFLPASSTTVPAPELRLEEEQP